MPKLTVEALAVPEAKKIFVSIYVSAINDLGEGVAGYKKGNFNISVLHEPGAFKTPSKEMVVFALETSAVQDLGNGFYKVTCENAQGAGFPSGRYVLSLIMNMVFSKKPGIGRGQTLVTFDI